MSRVIVITGATRGLGRALVPHFVKAGHAVIGCGRNADDVAELNALYPESQTEIGDFEVLDVSKPKEVFKWAEYALMRYGPPSLLINNAALMNTPAKLWDVPAEEFDQLFAVNVLGVANVIRAFVPAMVERGTGVIVNLSSGWGRSTSPEVAPYCASKHAIEGLTLALAQELPAGMAAIPLNPGVIDTDMLRQCWGGGASSFPTAEQWAIRAAPFLLKLTAKDNGKSLTVG